MAKQHKHCPILLSGWIAQYGAYKKTGNVMEYISCGKDCAWYDGRSKRCGFLPEKVKKRQVERNQSTANIDAHHLVDVLNKHKETTKELEAKLKELEED